MTGIPVAPRGPSRGFKGFQPEPAPLEDEEPIDWEELRSLKAKAETAMKAENKPRPVIDAKLEELETEFLARQRRKRKRKPQQDPSEGMGLEPEDEPEIPHPLQQPDRPRVQPAPMLILPQPAPSRMSFARSPQGPQLSRTASPFAMAASGVSPTAGPSIAAPSAAPSGPGGGPR
jgi:hypothetical protein